MIATPTRTRALALVCLFASAALCAAATACRRSTSDPDAPTTSAELASESPSNSTPAREPPATYVAIRWLPAPVAHWREGIEAVAVAHGLEPDLVAIVTLVESGGDPVARSRSGARGLMQILPLTGRHIATERTLAGHADQKLTDPRYNLDFGAWYLARQQTDFAREDFAETVDLVAAAYNGGPGRLARHLRGEVDLSHETERYVGWVGGMWRERRASRSQTYAKWWQAGGSRLVTRAAAALGLAVAPP